MTELTLARVRADLEAAKLVELYKGSTLLQGAPLPRFRLPEVTIDVPVMISHVEGEQPRSSDGYHKPKKPEIESAIAEAAAVSGLRLDDAQRASVVEATTSHVERAWGSSEAIERVVGLNRLLASEGARVLSSPPSTRPGPSHPPGATPPEQPPTPSAAKLKAFRNALEQRLNAKVLGAAGTGPRVVALVGTSELREAGDPSLVTRLSLTLREDGFELVSIERDDGTIDERLVPE